MYFPGDIVYMRSNRNSFIVVETDWKNHRIKVKKNKPDKYGRQRKVSSEKLEITAWYSMNDFILAKSSIKSKRGIF